LANQPSPYKQIIGARIPRELYVKVSILAEQQQIKISELLQLILERETQDVELTPEHYEQIAEEIRRAAAGQNPRGRKRGKKATGHSSEQKNEP